MINQKSELVEPEITKLSSQMRPSIIISKYACLQISISLKFYKDLQQHGSDQVLKEIYGNLVTDPEDGNYSLK